MLNQFMCTLHNPYKPDKTGAQLGYFKGRGFVAEIGHKDIGFPVEKFRAIV